MTSQALAARLRGQRAAGAAHVGHAAHDAVVDGTHTQRGEGKADLFLGAAIQNAVAQGLERGKIAGAEREEGNFVKTRLAEAIIQKAADIRQAAFPYRAIGHARMAETAAARTAARDFQGQTVMDGPDGHDLRRGVGGVVQIRHNAALRAVIRKKGAQASVTVRRKERGDVDARNMARLFQKGLARPVAGKGLFQQAQHVGQQFLPVAEHHQIDEGGQRFGAEERAASSHDQRAFPQAWGAPLRAERNARQIEHIQDVGVAELMRNGKAHGMELRQRRA